MKKFCLILFILALLIMTGSRAQAMYDAELKVGYHSLYYNVYNTLEGTEALKFGVDYQFNPNFSIITAYTLVPSQPFLSLNAKFKALEIERYDTIFSFLSGYRFSKQGGNFRIGPLFSKETNSSWRAMGGVLMLFHTSDGGVEDKSNYLYQLGAQRQLLSKRFGFEEVALELGISNMIAPEERSSGLILGLRNYW